MQEDSKANARHKRDKQKTNGGQTQDKHKDTKYNGLWWQRSPSAPKQTANIEQPITQLGEQKVSDSIRNGSDKYALIITTAPTQQIQFPMPWYSLWDHWCRAAASCICLCLHARKKVLVMQITGVAITSLSEQVQLTQRVDDMHAASRNYFASLKHSHIFKSVPRVRHG